jgi:hypothetical protein
MEGSLRARGGAGTGRPGRRRAIALLLVLPVLAPCPTRAGSPPPPTACITLCPSLPDPCTVGGGITVTPGSDIDCGDREVIVESGGSLTVHDGRFTLRGRTLRVRGTGQIVADCPAGTAVPGVTLYAANDLVVEGNGKVRADCGGGGGEITVRAGRDVTVGGNGITADGSAANGSGGAIRIAASGAIGVGAEVSASAFDSQQSVAVGGEITLTAGSTVGTTAALRAQGTNDTGGSVTVDAAGTVTLTGHVLADALRSGDGGQIEIRGRNLLITGRLVAKGVGAGSTGGTVQLDAGGTCDIRNDVIAKGGETGGTITAQAEGPVTIGQSGGAAFDLNVTAETGGEIELASAGDQVRVFATLTATDGLSGGQGGRIALEGASVTAESSSTIKADATGQGIGGAITIVARDQLVLNGWLRAAGGEALFVYRDTPPVVGPNVFPPWEQQQDTTLPPPCGDGVLRAGEQCDQLNLGEDANGNPNTCQSLGYGGGILRCSATCLFDTSSCTP